MERRTFLQLGMAAAATAHSLGEPINAVAANSKVSPAGTSRSQRRKELLDADWQFLQGAIVSIDDWIMTPGMVDEEKEMTSVNLDTSGARWTKTTPGTSTMAEHSFAWFRTVLQNITGPGRMIHFNCVDDNATIYLNGRKLLTHEGWGSGFDVILDSAWNPTGPNVLVVLVENINGPGGITGPVSAATVPPVGALGNSNQWETIHLPHDYVVAGTFAPTADTGHGSLPAVPAWYRKTIFVPATDRGKSVWLYFEGVFRNATVFINGKQAYFQEDGYDPFNVEIGEFLEYGKPNELSIHVNPSDFEGWWYEGGGIYRHVWMNVADPVHVVPWGVYVTSEVSNVTTSPSAELTIKTELINKNTAGKQIKVQTVIVSPRGQNTASVQSSHNIDGNGELTIFQTTSIQHAELWSLDAPNLYTAKTTITSDGVVLDNYEQKFGIRTIRFDVDKGFFLNEQSVKLQGTCNHQDFAGVGIAMCDNILYWRMQKLKERLGCNAIRCSHNPMTTAMYEACDALGLLVMDETRHPGDAVEPKAMPATTTYTHTDHIEKMIRRDRNHPSVIMWSLSNEEWAVCSIPFGSTMLKALMTAVHKHDTTRPITTGCNMGTGDVWRSGYGPVEDLLGVNYNYQDYDWLRENMPGKPIFGSEIASDVSCRGVYQRDDAAAHLSAYMTPENSWSPLGTREFVAGGFVWTGFDYRGETTPYSWPEVNSNYGLLDLCGFPKDAAFWYLAWWKQETPLVHMLPHWNWAGKEGQTVPVWCFSNCDTVELFVNGVSQGLQAMPRFGHVEWDNVVYQPGHMKIVGYNAGTVAATKVVETTGAPAGIKLHADRLLLLADGEDTIPVEVSIVDSAGRVVPTANNLVRFSITGAGVSAGVGNGDPASHELNHADTRSAFAGLCLVLVKATENPGQITLTATAEGVEGARLTFLSA